MKAKDLLLDDETLFKNEEVLTAGYQPPELNHRDEQLKALSLSLKPGLRGVAPLNTLMHGPPGTGKTTSLKHVFSEVAEVSGKIVTVYINCEDSSTRFNVFARIHEKVFGHSPPDTGKPLDSVKEKVFKKLERDGKTLVVALDEIDHLFREKKADKILVDLLKSHTTYGYDKVGVIGILIDEAVLAGLDAKTRSVFNPERIYYPPYSRAEVEEILAERAKYGFHQGVVGKKVLDAVVDKTAASGDLRVGIDLLHKSGLLAERDSERKVSLKHVEDAFERESRHLNLARTVGALSDDERGLLAHIITSGESNSGRLYEGLKAACGVGIKKYNEMVGKLEHSRIVDTRYAEGARGRSRSVTLRYEPAEVKDALNKK